MRGIWERMRKYGGGGYKGEDEGLLDEMKGIWEEMRGIRWWIRVDRGNMGGDVGIWKDMR